MDQNFYWYPIMLLESSLPPTPNMMQYQVQQWRAKGPKIHGYIFTDLFTDIIKCALYLFGRLYFSVMYAWGNNSSTLLKSFLFVEPTSWCCFTPYYELLFRSGGCIRGKHDFFWAMGKDIAVNKKDLFSFMRMLKIHWYIDVSWCQYIDISM